MNLDTIRDKIKSYLGLHKKFIYRGARNQIEELNQESCDKENC